VEDTKQNSLKGAMTFTFSQRDIITVNDFSKTEILHILEHTEKLKNKPQTDLLKGKILGSCFFEPSTRTRLSFEAAMLRLGGSVVGFADANITSTKKGESLADTMKMMENYVDLIVMRHPLEGAAQHAADVVGVPVINAGDGSHQHPTQTFLDLFTIRESQKKLDGLNIALVGDLKYGRTVHSLAQAFIHFNPRFYFISPPLLELPKEICDELREKGIKFSFHKSIEDVIDKLDIMYMTRIQEERFVHKMEYESVKNAFHITLDQLHNVKPNFKILHPLPRINEIDISVDASPYASYFQQAENGLYVRQALLGLVLGETQAKA